MQKVNEKQKEKKIVNAVIFFTQPFYDETGLKKLVRKETCTTRIKNLKKKIDEFFKRVKRILGFKQKKLDEKKNRNEQKSKEKKPDYY